MRSIVLSIGLFFIAVIALQAQQQQQLRQQYRAPNRRIDYSGFLTNAVEVGKLRQVRRVSEQDFIEMSQEIDTIIFDARSDSKYQMLHIKGAKHVSLPDITEAELAKVIPTKGTRVLIYCNNNFENEPAAFPTKAVRASLNLYTFNTLYSYGYTNVYELGPLIDIQNSKLEFEGTKLAHRP
jgi:3-mercaptopyruvate sulfurtransferase SseA